MQKVNEKIISFNNHKTYYSVAHRNYLEIQRIKSELDELQRKLKDRKTTNADIDFICERNAAIQRHAIVVVIFSAFALEAFINNYAIENFSKSYLENYLDRLEPDSKWVIITKLVNGRQLNTDSHAFELLKHLFSFRNKLAHYKTKTKPIDEIRDDDWIGLGEAESAIKTVWSIIEELGKIDNKISTDWLNDAERDPFV